METESGLMNIITAFIKTHAKINQKFLDDSKYIQRCEMRCSGLNLKKKLTSLEKKI